MKRACIASLILGAALIADEATAVKSLDRWNWSNNIEFTAKQVIQPKSVEELQ